MDGRSGRGAEADGARGIQRGGIAAALGAASRCAVIGKANRIGSSSMAAGAALRRVTSRASWHRRSPLRTRPAISPPPPFPTEVRTPAWPSPAVEVGEMRRVRFDDIRHFVCRWPLGDPRNGDFAYCGLTPAKGRPYCAGHCRMAYRPPNAGPRASPARAAMVPRARQSVAPVLKASFDASVGARVKPVHDGRMQRVAPAWWRVLPALEPGAPEPSFRQSEPQSAP